MLDTVNSSTSYTYDPRTRTYLQPAYAAQTLQNFLTVKAFPTPIFLDHHVGNFVDALIGREALLALQTLAASADRIRFFALARIDHLVIFKPAEGALHMALGVAQEYQ